MTSAIPNSSHMPVEFNPGMEVAEADEAATKEGLVTTLQKISQTTFHDGGHALRSVHAKSHGLLLGQLQVLPQLPETLAQGLFANSGEWPVVMRYSTIPGDLLDDSVSTPRGLAIKVVGVPGDRLAGSEGDSTQDFVLVNGPVFAAPGPKKFLGSLKLLATTTDKAPGLKKVLSAVLRGTERALEAVGGESGILKSLGGHPETHLLGDTYYSQVPILYGRYIAKIAVVPVSPELTVLTDAALNVNGKPHGLRDAIVDFFATHAETWEIRVQLCTDLHTMPIEDASVAWPEDESPYLAVARIVVPKQVGWSDARSAAIDDRMAFSPWHGIAAHRPLGAVMRVRKAAYTASAKFRAVSNRVAIREPKSAADLPE
jgi:hypothetical protein